MDRSDDLRSGRLFAAIAKTESILSACAMFQTDAANLSRQLSHPWVRGRFWIVRCAPWH